MTIKTLLGTAALLAVLAAPAMAQNSYGWDGDDGWDTSGFTNGGSTRPNRAYTYWGPYDTSRATAQWAGTNYPGTGDPGGAPNKGNCKCGR